MAIRFPRRRKFRLPLSCHESWPCRLGGFLAPCAQISGVCQKVVQTISSAGYGGGVRGTKPIGLGNDEARNIVEIAGDTLGLPIEGGGLFIELSVCLQKAEPGTPRRLGRLPINCFFFVGLTTADHVHAGRWTSSLSKSLQLMERTPVA